MAWERYQAGTHRKATHALFERVAVDGLPVLTEFKAMRIDDPSAASGFVYVDEGRVLAYVQVASHPSGVAGSPHAAIEIVTEPGFPPEKVIEIALEAVPPGRRHVVWAWREDLAAALADRGYEQTRALHRLERALPVAEEPRFPDGVTVSTFVVGRDEAAWIETNNLAFAGHPENGAIDLNDLASRTSRPWFDPEGIVMAWDGGILVGSCWTKLHEGGTGEIYIVGVRPEAQGKGLGRALVLAGLADLHERQGADRGMLFVDDANTAAMWLYEELGFERAFTNRMYEPASQPNR